MQSGSDCRQLLIVQDQPLIAFAMQRLIGGIDNGIATAVCGCARSALDKLRAGTWHRVLLAPDMPGAAGMSLARRACELGMAQRCALVAGISNPAWIHEAQARGMLGYILNTATVERFAADLRAVLEGRPVFAATHAPGTSIRLTPRQEEILILLRSGRSSKQIAAQMGISEGTVNNHVAAVLRIFGVTSRTQAIARAVELGYMQWRQN